MNEKEPIITIIQTRRGSSRLPDKVLMPLQGKPLFVRQAERVLASRLRGRVIIATTTEESDDPIEAVCRQEGLECFRGDPLDLLDRHYQAALRYGAEAVGSNNPAGAVVKIPSDCPLIDPAIIDQVIEFYLSRVNDPAGMGAGAFDFVSNLHPATWPDGNDVEVMRFDALEQAWKEAVRPLEREHTTPFLWERPERFRIGNVTMEGGLDYSMSHRFTIDYAEDYAFIKAVYDELYPVNPLFGVQDILDLLERRPDIYAINAEFAGVNWYRHHLNELKTVGAEQTKQL